MKNIRNLLVLFISFICVNHSYGQVDTTRPTVTLSTAENPTNAKLLPIDIILSEKVTNLVLKDLVIKNATGENLRNLPDVDQKQETYTDVTSDLIGNLYFIQGNTINVIDENGVKTTLEIGDEVRGLRNILLNNQGNIIVSILTSAKKKIEIYDITGQHIHSIGNLGTEENFKGLYCIALDNVGNIYAAEGGQIQVFDSKGNYLKNIGDGLFSYVNDMHIASDGNIYAVDQISNEIIAVDREGNFLFMFEKRSENKHQFDFEPNGITADSDGNFYITDSNNSVVSVFNSQGQYLYDLAYTFNCCISEIHIDSNNNIHVIDNRNYTVLKTSINYRIDLIPELTDGFVEVKITENSITDKAGNGNKASNILNIEVDNTPPTLSINSSESETTILKSIPVEFVFNEPVSYFITGQSRFLSKKNCSIENIQGVGETWPYSKYTAEIVPDEKPGEFLIAVGSGFGGFADIAGNTNIQNSRFEIKFKTDIVHSTLHYEGNDLTNKNPFDIEIFFTEPIFNFSESDITLSNGTINSFEKMSEYSYKTRIKPINDGLVKISLLEGIAEDLDGNGNLPSNEVTITYDGTAPISTMISRNTSRSETNPVLVEINFSEPVTDFIREDLVIDNGSILNFEGSNSNYTVEVQPKDGYSFTIEIPSSVARDEARNLNIGSAYSYSPPYIVSVAPFISNQSPTVIEIEFNEDVTDFSLNDLIIVGGSVLNLSGSDGKTYSFEVVPAQEGIISISIPSSSVFDEFGTGNEELNDFSILYDITGPTVSISSIDVITTFNETVPIEIAFSEPVFNFSFDPISCLVFGNQCFTADDIDIKRATITGFSRKDGRDDTFIAELIPDYLGTIEIQIPEGTVFDLADNGNTASEVKEITYNNGLVTNIEGSVDSNQIIDYYIEDQFLNVKIKNNYKRSAVSILDMSGKIFINTVHNESSEIRLNIAHLPTAPYILMVQNDNSFRVSKFFINKR